MALVCGSEHDGDVHIAKPARITVRAYVDEQGRSPFEHWFASLATSSALKIRSALAGLEAGNLSALTELGQGVHEVRADFGPGYRAYLGMDGEALAILLGGSVKARQNGAIADAQERWAEYQRRNPRNK